MFTYSRKDMERQLLADQALWSRFPVSAAAVLWPLEIAVLGWANGWWLGLLTVVFLGIISVLVPPRLSAGIYLADLLQAALKLPFSLAWLLLVWYLWLREPILPVMGHPLPGALGITAGLWVSTRILVFASRMLAGRVRLRKDA